jgi:hypothetical protein
MGAQARANCLQIVEGIANDSPILFHCTDQFLSFFMRELVTDNHWGFLIAIQEDKL